MSESGIIQSTNVLIDQDNNESGDTYGEHHTELTKVIPDSSLDFDPTHNISDSELKEQRIKIVELVRNHSQRQVADILGISQSAVKRAVEYDRKYKLDIKRPVTSEGRRLDDYQKLKQEPANGQSQVSNVIEDRPPSKDEIFWVYTMSV